MKRITGRRQEYILFLSRERVPVQGYQGVTEGSVHLQRGSHFSPSWDITRLRHPKHASRGSQWRPKVSRMVWAYWTMFIHLRARRASAASGRNFSSGWNSAVHLWPETGERSISQFTSVQSLSRVQLFVTPWIAAPQASLSITNSWSLLKLMPIELVMPSSHLILCRPLLLLPPTPSSIRVFSNESTLHIMTPKWEVISATVAFLRSLLRVNTQRSAEQGCSGVHFHHFAVCSWKHLA